jgi:hypothetical protein
MSEWSAIQYLPVGAVVAKRRDMPSELWVKKLEAQQRIAELDAEIAALKEDMTNCHNALVNTKEKAEAAIERVKACPVHTMLRDGEWCDAVMDEHIQAALATEDEPCS